MKIDLIGDYRVVSITDEQLGDAARFCDVAEPYCLVHRKTTGFYVFMQRTGENVVPYFDTGLYIDLDTRSIILRGIKNGEDIVISSIPLLCDEFKIQCTRDQLLVALERFVNHPIMECFVVDASAGSIIAQSIGVLTQRRQADILYYGFSRAFYNPNFNRMSYFVQLVRTIDRDYLLRSCIGNPNFCFHVVKALGFKDVNGHELEKFMSEGKYNIDRKLHPVAGMSEDVIDLGRVIKRIKEV